YTNETCLHVNRAETLVKISAPRAEQTYQIRGQLAVRPRGLSRCGLRVSGLLRRNAQHLAGIDLVGIAQHRPVRLEDVGIAAAVAEMLLGDLPERVALDHGVEYRLRRRFGGGDAFFDLGDAGDIADGEDHLLLHLLAHGAAAHLHRVALDTDVEAPALEAEVGDLLLQRLGVRRRLGRLGTADPERLAGILDEIPETHGANLPLTMPRSSTSATPGASGIAPARRHR